MTTNPFKGKRGLSANGFQVLDVAAPETPSSATPRQWTEKFIRLNDYDLSQSYPAGRFVYRNGRLRRSNDVTTPGAFNESEWDRPLTQMYASIRGNGYTLQNQDLIMANNQSDPITLYLPDDPLLGYHIEVIDNQGKSNENPIRIETTDGRGIQGGGIASPDYTIQSKFDHVSFYFDGVRWIAKSYDLPSSRIVNGGTHLASAGETILVRNVSSVDDTIIQLPSSPYRGCFIRVGDTRPVRTASIRVESSEYMVNGSEDPDVIKPGDEVAYIFVSTTVGWISSSTSKYIPSDWTFVDESSVLKINSKVLVSSVDGDVELTLPVNGIFDGQSIQVVDYGRAVEANPISIVSTSNTINGSPNPITIEIPGESLTLAFVGGEWKTTRVDVVTQDQLAEVLNDIGESLVNITEDIEESISELDQKIETRVTKDQWESEVFSITKNEQNIKITVPPQTTLVASSITPTSEVFVNSVRMIVGIDFSVDYDTSEMMFDEANPLKLDDIVTIVTFGIERSTP